MVVNERVDFFAEMVGACSVYAGRLGARGERVCAYFGLKAQ